MASSIDLTGAAPQAALRPTIKEIDGVRLASAASGSRYHGRDDLVVIELAPSCTFHCLYTKNKFCAAPVIVARRHQQRAHPRYLVINAGNANAGTGRNGEDAALETCAAFAAAGGCSNEAVLPYSTGVIGLQLDAGVLTACIPSLLRDLRPDAWPDAANAILTTDTRSKLRSATVRSGGFEFSVTGMAKGSGMIKPDMATMLAYVATDAAVGNEALAAIVRRAAAASFNRISVDGDTSTNDAFALIASGAAGNPVIASERSEHYAALLAAVELVCIELAKDIVRDGEGATKFVEVNVAGGHSAEDCRRVAYTVAESPLVKTALFASDPNWGRILAAVGRAGTEAMDIDAVSIDIGGHPILRAGEPAADYDEAAVQKVMKGAEIVIDISIGDGSCASTVWTCDFSYDYVKINAEYRS